MVVLTLLHCPDSACCCFCCCGLHAGLGQDVSVVALDGPDHGCYWQRSLVFLAGCGHCSSPVHHRYWLPEKIMKC
ncbi:hypothetical protein DPMN_103059 [Dreissena polymorpha]|uniref:Secreted protein n=1 Tax=Dreissena polymorpha TaxID=45954 RepID=A0A9D4H962_DREPO|nr:hypothetical protein DPMN_103059 [Dreissena polymorpha]